MRKLALVILGLLAAAGVAGSVYFAISYKRVSAERETLLQQTAQLQQSIESIGPMATAYTVKANVSVSDKIKSDDLMEISIPQAIMTDSTVTDPEQIIGKLYKVNLSTGTPLTMDVVMDEMFADTVYEQDMTFGYIPLGLKVGDYIDVKVGFPMGETFLALTHKRVSQVVTDANTIKVMLTPAEQSIWQSILRDCAQYKNIGCYTFVSKYVEPGVQGDTIAFYPVRKEMEAVETLNPNIKDKSLLINSNLRTQMEVMLANVSTETGSLMAAGVSQEAAGIETAKPLYYEETENQADVVVDENGEAGSNGDLLEIEDSSDNSSNVDDTSGDSTSTSEGESSFVTSDEENAADGDSVFSAEDPVE